VQNKGTITGQTELGGGNDIFDGRGGTAGPVFGEDGDDKLFGGNGHDVLTGGTGADTFDFTAIKAIGKGANRDVIQDFASSDLDVIDLSSIDANTQKAHNQAFHFIGSHAFHHRAGELHFINHILSGDVNGDGKADFEIGIPLPANLAASDFHL
jgi:serralysin